MSERHYNRLMEKSDSVNLALQIKAELIANNAILAQIYNILPCIIRITGYHGGGHNMMRYNNKNLKPFTSEQSREEAVKNGRAGGIASGEARRQKKALKEFLSDFLNQEADIPLALWMLNNGVSIEDCTNMGAIVVSVFDSAMNGNVAAARTLLEWAGMLPEVKEQRRKTIKDDYPPKNGNINSYVKIYTADHIEASDPED